MARFLIVFFFSLLFLLGIGSDVTPQFFEAGVQKLEKPVSAPDFTLKLLGGGQISLGELRGKVVVLDFFAPWCPICRKGASSFDKLAEAFKTKEVVFLFIAIREDEKDLRKFKEEFKISIPILSDESGRVAKSYRVFGHHEIFFINTKGKIVGKAFGVEDWSSEGMRKLIQHLLAEGS